MTTLVFIGLPLAFVVTLLGIGLITLFFGDDT